MNVPAEDSLGRFLVPEAAKHFGWMPGDKEIEGFFSRFCGGGAKEAPVAAKKRSV